MFSPITLVWLAAVSLLPLAKAVKFKIQQQEVQTDVPHTRNIAAEVFHMHKKRGFRLTKDMAASQNNVTANPEYAMLDRLYLSPVSIGTPPQTLMMQFDTGSSDFWVFSDLQPAANRKGHKFFNHSRSSTFTPINGSSWSIVYADGGSAMGVIGTDVVNIGGISTRQGVEIAQHVSASFTKDKKTNGIVGLGFSANNQGHPQQRTFFSNVGPTLDSPVMCASFMYRQPGSFAFGYIDHSVSTFPYQTFNSDTNWGIAIDGYRIGPGDVTPATINAIVDTGTAGIVMDDAIVQNYWGQVQGASLDTKSGLWTFPCSAMLPVLTLQFPNASGVDYQAYLGPPEFIYKTTSSKCFGGLIGNNGNGQTILGDIFINNGLTCFDLSSGSPRIGIQPYLPYF